MLSLFLLSTCVVFAQLTPVDYVNPKIGTISQVLVPTYPTVSLPNGMVRFYPRRQDSGSETLQNFPLTLSSHRGDQLFNTQVTATGTNSGLYDLEVIKPYEYHAYLVDDRVDINLAVSHQAALLKFEFEGNQERRVNIPADKVDGANACQGRQHINGNGDDNTYVYIYVDFSPAPSSQNGCEAHWGGGVTVAYARYGVSHISYDQAHKNLLREIPAFDYNATVAKGKQAWNDVLGRIDVTQASRSSFVPLSNGAEDPLPLMPEKDKADAELEDYNNKVKFYTGMYRVYERMVRISEDGQYYSAYNHKVNDDGGVPFYVDDWIWDTFRAAHPLRALIDPFVEGSMLASYIRMAQQSSEGWLPTFPEVSGDSHRMNGNHGIPTIIDGWVKGITNVFSLADGYKASYGAITEKSFLPWTKRAATEYDTFYQRSGFFPGLRAGQGEYINGVNSGERRQCVAVTLAAAFDQWCLAQQARALGNTEDYTRFLRRSYDFQNLYKEDTAFFHPKDNESNFITPFDYEFSGGQGARDYYDENNGWTYRWDVQHNEARLVELMGGPAQFVKNLDQTYAQPMSTSRSEFFSKLPDQTGNVGQFTMANEPSMHIPVIYNFGRQPWKTQKRVPLLLKQWFRNDLYGVPGDEDGGGLSAFAVFGSLGLYPVTPGLPVYTIHSPIFSHSVLKVGPDQVTFTIQAVNLSPRNRYIQSVTRNGAAWPNSYISHEEILKGGNLILTMGPTANREWGTTPPPSSEPYPN